MKSCSTCPSFTDKPVDVNAAFGKAIGMPMCLRYGHILGSPTKNPADDAQVQQFYADGCPDHNVPAPATPVEISLRVSESREDTTPKTGAVIQACNTCTHYVTPQACNTTLSVTQGACMVKGKLVLSAVNECVNCEWAEVGQPHQDTNAMRLLPQYGPGFKFENIRAVERLMGAAQIDPTEYDSDLPLTEADKALGIRAWRNIEDPEGIGKPAAIPIFSVDAFPEHLAELVPQRGGSGNPEEYIDHGGVLYAAAVDSWQLNDTLCLVGEPGTGKTEAVRFMAYNTRMPFQRISFTEETEVDDVIGKILFSPERGTYFQKGRVTTFAECPGWDLWDEFNAAGDALKQMARPFFDNSRVFRLDQADGAEVKIHMAHRTVHAINPAWDFRNLGVSEFAGADVSRMSFKELDYPPDEIVKEIVRKACAHLDYQISEDTISTILRVSEDLREASEQGTYPFTWQVREVVKVARKTKFYGIQKAFRSAIGDYLEPTARELAMTIIQGHLA